MVWTPPMWSEEGDSGPGTKQEEREHGHMLAKHKKYKWQKKVDHESQCTVGPIKIKWKLNVFLYFPPFFLSSLVLSCFITSSSIQLSHTCLLHIHPHWIKKNKSAFIQIYTIVLFLKSLPCLPPFSARRSIFNCSVWETDLELKPIFHH